MENLIVDLRRRNAGLMRLKARLLAGILASIKAYRDVNAHRRLLLSLPGFCPVAAAKTDKAARARSIVQGKPRRPTRGNRAS